MQIYRCPKNCSINKHCFIVKTKEKLKDKITVLMKCPEKNGEDIEIKIGGKPP